jgi:adenine-specific DNA-methyltransferase
MQDVKLYWPQNNQNKKLYDTKKMKELPYDESKNSNLLFHSDNLVAMNYLIKTGFTRKIDLIYIDPPFCSNENYFLRKKNSQHVAFSDIWKGKMSEYLNMIYPRLCAMQHLLSESGSIFIHLDWHVVHYVKVIMDEIFKPENFRNEIIIKRGRRKNLLYQFKSIDRMHHSNDSILWYSKSPDARYSPPLVEYASESKWMGFWSNVNRPTMRYEMFGYTPKRGQWKWSKARASKAIINYETYKRRFYYFSLDQYWNQTGKKQEFIRKRDGVKYPEYWIPAKTHKILDNIWTDIESYDYSTGYGTEKHVALLERIIEKFSKPGNLIADFFCGSGTTLVVASKTRRRWIGCDSSSMAIKITRKRLADYNFKLLVS